MRYTCIACTLLVWVYPVIVVILQPELKLLYRSTHIMMRAWAYITLHHPHVINSKVQKQLAQTNEAMKARTWFTWSLPSFTVMGDTFRMACFVWRKKVRIASELPIANRHACHLWGQSGLYNSTRATSKFIWRHPPPEQVTKQRDPFHALRASKPLPITGIFTTRYRTSRHTNSSVVLTTEHILLPQHSPSVRSSIKTVLTIFSHP